MMARATLQQLQQQQGTTVAPPAEDEALKKNTDCVYFLTSPLACKKGAECEYRHSEYARVNPRDCYFWLNGNCLNPKCGFRHPPLDGLFGTETEATVPPMRATTAAAVHAPQNHVKAPVQCFYFQKGYCARGDKCGFLHGPNPTDTKSSQQIVPSSSTEIPPTKPHSSHQNFHPEAKTKQTKFSKAVEAHVETKSTPKLETVSRRNGIDRYLPPSKNLLDEARKYKATSLPSAFNGNLSRYNRIHQLQVPDDHGSLNGKDADNFLRESSPGFDVLVDDELRSSDFHHGEDQSGRMRSQEGRNANEYDIDHAVDYSSVCDMDPETYRDYDNYENTRGQYGWEQTHRESRGYSNVDSDDVDLRYRLLKQSRGNGLRSVASHDFASERIVEDRGYRGSSPRESSISGRLRGRIKPPRSPRTSVETGRRLQDRIGATVAEDFDIGRNYRGPRMRRDRSSQFVGTKSLTELKGTEQQSVRKRKQSGPAEGDVSFKGPMPLSEILKRKRRQVEHEKAVGNDCADEGMEDEQKQYEGEEQREGEYEYEQGEEGENAEADDDFAKKIGVVSS